jgi:hypothetical protein
MSCRCREDAVYKVELWTMSKYHSINSLFIYSVQSFRSFAVLNMTKLVVASLFGSLLTANALPSRIVARGADTNTTGNLQTFTGMLAWNAIKCRIRRSATCSNHLLWRFWKAFHRQWSNVCRFRLSGSSQVLLTDF